MKQTFLFFLLLSQNIFAGTIYDVSGVTCENREGSYFKLNMQTELIMAKIKNVELTNKYSIDPHEPGENVEISVPDEDESGGSIGSLITIGRSHQGFGSLLLLLKKSDFKDLENGERELLYTQFSGKEIKEKLNCQFKLK